MTQQVLSLQPMLKDPVVVFKGSSFTLTILVVSSFDLNLIKQDLAAQLAKGPKFFLHAPVVVDLSPLKALEGELDFVELACILRDAELVPVGVCNGAPDLYPLAIAAGFAVLQSGPQSGTAQPREKKLELKAEQSDSIELSTPTPVPKTEALVITKPVRSGQQVYARGRDLILLAQVNAGAEVISDGNIHVYAPLRGRALAGAQGDSSARIFSQNFAAEMVSIAGNYRTFEDNPAPDVADKPSHVYLDGEHLVVAPLEL